MNSHDTKIAFRSSIVTLGGIGMQEQQIAEHLGCDLRTVRKWIRRDQESGNLNDSLRTGRPKELSDEQVRAIRQQIEHRPFTNAVELKRLLDLNVTPDCIRKRLHKEGLHHRTPTEKDFLEPRHIAARLQFANDHIHHDWDFWSRVIFSDEKTFQSTNHGRLHCWRMNGTR